jgi:acyl-CoA thioesterase FadM
MARIKINLPEKFIFSTDIPVRITDINYGGHLGNDSMLSIIHEARVKFLKNYGFGELDAGGAGIIMTDAAICFMAEIFYGTVIKVNVALEDFNNLGCDVVFQLLDSANGKELARAKTGIVFFDYQRRRPVKIPDAFMSAVGIEPQK